MVAATAQYLFTRIASRTRHRATLRCVDAATVRCVVPSGVYPVRFPPALGRILVLPVVLAGANSLGSGLGIRNIYIKPATPRLNGKVERSQRIDGEEF